MRGRQGEWRRHSSGKRMARRGCKVGKGGSEEHACQSDIDAESGCLDRRLLGSGLDGDGAEGEVG